MNKTFIFLVIAMFLFSSFAVVTETKAATYPQIKTTIVDSLGQTAYDCSLALDSAGNPHISYTDGNGTGLKYAWFDGNSWHIQVVEGGGVTGQNGLHSSLALDANGNPHISYLDLDANYYRDLMYAHWDGQRWIIQNIEPSNNSWHSSIAIDSKGNPHISYNGGYSLKYASWDGSSWVRDVVDAGSGGTDHIIVGTYNCLKLDSQDKPHISYYHETNGDLKYAYWDEGWNTEIVDSAGNVGADNSLALDSANRPCISYSSNTGLKYAAWNSSNWNIQIIDFTSDLHAIVGASSSLALDSKSTPHISYIDQSRGILKYTYSNGSSWQIYGLSEKAEQGYTTSLEIGLNNTVHIVHNDYTNHVLQYMTFNPAMLPPPIPILDPPPLTPPDPYTIPTSPIGIVTIVDPKGFNGLYTSLALDKFGNAHISYYDKTYGLKYASCNGTHWRIEVVDCNAWSGWYSSLALDSNGYAHISYLDPYNSCLKYAHWNGTKWNIQTVDAGDVGSFSSIAIDSEGHPHISYCDGGNIDLKYATWNGSSWDIQTVDSQGWVGGSTSLALDSQGKPHIAYSDITNRDLKFATKTDNGWSISAIDSEGDVGRNPCIKIDQNNIVYVSYFDATNGKVKVARSSGSSWVIQAVDYLGNPDLYLNSAHRNPLALDSNGNPHIAYYSTATSSLKHAYLSGSQWVIQTADSTANAGWYSSIGVDAKGTAHISYYDEDGQVLRYIALPQGVAPPSPTPSPTPKPAPTPNPTPTAPENVKTPTNLELTCQSTTLSNSFNVEIGGKLSGSEKNIPNADIQLSYCVSTGQKWVSLPTVKTDDNGRFAADWQLPASGIYTVKALWSGDQKYEQSAKTISFAVTPFQNNEVFSITSNSTITDLKFDSANMQLSLMVNGSSETTGYINIVMAQSLVPNADALKIYLDGKEVAHTIEAQSDYWLITFTYHHSSHKVTIDLVPSTTQNSNQVEVWLLIPIAATAIAVIAAFSLMYKQKRHRS
jgi:hypothetical protein